MRLIHLSRARKHVVDVDREPSETPAATAEEAEAEQHVTTDRLKRQFEDRLAARAQRRRTQR